MNTVYNGREYNLKLQCFTRLQIHINNLVSNTNVDEYKQIFKCIINNLKINTIEQLL